MKSILAPLVLALLLLVAGVVSWTLGQAQERMAQVEAQVATMEYGAVVDDDGELDRVLASATRVPRFGDQMAQAARGGRATAAYWLGRYDELAFERDAGGALVERDPRLLLLAANAAYRASRLDTVDRDTALERLDVIVRNYADVLKSGAAGNVSDGNDTGPGNDVTDILADAAYNYELATRLRTTLERARPGAKPEPKPKPERAPSTIHGQQGGPPINSDMQEFRIVIPKRSDERDQNPEGGQGQQRIRKG
jgi:HAMP domain-containing protein